MTSRTAIKKFTWEEGGGVKSEGGVESLEEGWGGGLEEFLLGAAPPSHTHFLTPGTCVEEGVVPFQFQSRRSLFFLRQHFKPA